MENRLKKNGKAGGKKNPDQSCSGEEKLKAAVQAGSKRDYRGAARILEELISGSDTPPAAFLLLGRSLHSLGDYSRALASFKDYLRIKPYSAQGYFFAGRTCLSLDMPQKAVSLFKRALELKNDDPLTLAMLGIAYLKSRRSGQAVETLQAAVEGFGGADSGAAASAGREPLPPDDRKRIYRAYLNALLVRGLRLCRGQDYALGSLMLNFVLENSAPEDGDSASVGNFPLIHLELGRACRAQGLLEDALNHYSLALEASPGDMRIRWYRASMLMELGRTAEAVAEIDRIRSLDGDIPDLPWNGELVDRYMIRSFLELGEWRRAADLCRAQLQTGRKDPRIHAMFAEALRNLKDFKAAYNHLERAVELDGRRIDLRYAQILVAWEAGDLQGLQKALRAATSLGGDTDILEGFSLLLEAKTSGNVREIITKLQDNIRRLGPNLEIMYALGENYLKAGLLEEALSWFRKIKLLSKHHERSYLGEIAALQALADEVNALSAIKTGRSGGLGLLEAAEEIRRRTPNGRAKAGKPLGTGSQERPVHILTELRAAYAEYLQLWPDNYSIRREFALFLVQIHEYAQAADELGALLAREPGNPSLRRVLAYTYRKTGRYREAAVFLKALLREKPEDLGILLEFSGCLERSGSASYAVAVLEKAMPLFTLSPDLPLMLGIFFYRQQKTEKARDYLREALNRSPHDKRPCTWLALIAENSGQTDEAQKYRRQAERRPGEYL
ncbi:MAG: tetratricopeptide repeat protein [Treponema sp.]|jgi:tetratricopeptide (TPR) repeat protein|nr:tetratricopeptide repeat protein [Treponema sp.]